MAITLEAATRTAACDAVVDLIDGGSGAGYMTICTSGDAVLATVTFGDPAFGGASSGVATSAAIAGSPFTATGTGTAAKIKIYNSSNTLIFSGTAGTSAADLILTNLSIAENDTIAIGTGAITVTMPATPA